MYGEAEMHALLCAGRRGDLEACKTILAEIGLDAQNIYRGNEKGPDAIGSLLLAAAGAGWFPIVQHVVETYGHKLATISKKENLAKIGVNVDADNDFGIKDLTIYMAAKNSHPTVCQYLINHANEDHTRLQLMSTVMLANTIYPGSLAIN